MSEDIAKKDAAGRTVFVKTYGCQMNVYDSERMVSLLRPLGYRPVEAADGADLVILNTCHIREKAAEKLYSDLGRLRRTKDASDRAMTVAVAGCVAQAEGAEVAARADIVDIVVGPQAYHRLPELIARAARREGVVLDTDFSVDEKFDALARDRAAEGVSAYVTVQEGCDKFCAFCVVPYTRGAEISRSAEAIIAETRRLAAGGVREVTLLGQNVNAWASAPPPSARPGIWGFRPRADGTWGLGELCRALARIDGLERIRFTTSHPRDMDDGLIDALGEETKLMPYLHLPVQAGSDRILKAMNRGHTAADYLSLIGRIRAARPDIALSGDFIVGFPGETSEDFEDTLALTRAVGYASAFSFKYSRRPGTPAAVMPKQVAEEEKDRRLEALQARIKTQRDAFCDSLVGKDLPVLFERAGRKDGQLIGKTPYLQSVHAYAPASLIGEVARVRIEAVTPNALAGELAGESIEGRPARLKVGDAEETRV
ncbi:MAG: tRNA (N6-isopentenyl adenosine(37)-C2)-methylthiotransferase MiaB [Parvularculaceae bacterium]|nr:tRNA (N6-isopentenyl adenosine(37)-C2)-methylthiotransferase MiaB [Parvularculaceae bacterium]